MGGFSSKFEMINRSTINLELYITVYYIYTHICIYTHIHTHTKSSAGWIQNHPNSVVNEQ